jgi:hypothetical protein
MSPKTVLRVLRQPDRPHANIGRRGPTALDPHRADIEAWITGGGTNTADLYRVIRNMQLAGVLSLFCCTGTMFLLFFSRTGVAEVVFSVGLILMMVSLGISAEEICVSVRALDVHLTDLGEKRDAGTES